MRLTDKLDPDETISLKYKAKQIKDLIEKKTLKHMNIIQKEHSNTGGGFVERIEECV